jgi:hypothetical protein
MFPFLIPINPVIGRIRVEIYSPSTSDYWLGI